MCQNLCFKRVENILRKHFFKSKHFDDLTFLQKLQRNYIKLIYDRFYKSISSVNDQ